MRQNERRPTAFIVTTAAPCSCAWRQQRESGSPLKGALGDSTEHSFSDAPAGTLDYVCGIHGARMSGRIIIDASLPVP
jgi:plastocyanin